jgi:hypothetical protein
MERDIRRNHPANTSIFQNYEENKYMLLNESPWKLI